MLRIDGVRVIRKKINLLKYKNISLKYIKDIVKSEKLPFLVLFFSMIILHRFIIMASDDLWFAQVAPRYDFTNYISWRYMTWTGRVSVESVLYYIFIDSGRLWRLINPIFITLFTFSISRIIIGRSNLDQEKSRMLNWFICLGWLYISKEVLNESVFWITGSINYLWTMTMAILALIPYRDALMKEDNGKFNILFIIFAFFAAMGQEQVALILGSFSIISIIHLFMRDKRVNKYLLIQTAFIFIGAAVLFLAPGNIARVHSETNTWLPNYSFYTKWEFAFYGIQWFLDCLINHSRLIFLLLLSTVGIISYKKYNGLRNGVFPLIPLMGSVLLTIAVVFLDTKQFINLVHFPAIYNSFGNRIQNLLFNFDSTFILNNFRTIKYILWPVLLLLIPFYLIAIFEFGFKSVYTVLIYLAGISSAVVIFISPTIYASGYRTFFSLNVLFFITFIVLLKNIQQLLKIKYLILFSIVPIYTYMILLFKM